MKKALYVLGAIAGCYLAVPSVSYACSPDFVRIENELGFKAFQQLKRPVSDIGAVDVTDKQFSGSDANGCPTQYIWQFNLSFKDGCSIAVQSDSKHGVSVVRPYAKKECDKDVAG